MIDDERLVRLSESHAGDEREEGPIWNLHCSPIIKSLTPRRVSAMRNNRSRRAERAPPFCLLASCLLPPNIRWDIRGKAPA
jgi:hypothetical protein